MRDVLAIPTFRLRSSQRIQSCCQELMYRTAFPVASSRLFGEFWGCCLVSTRRRKAVAHSSCSASMDATSQPKLDLARRTSGSFMRGLHASKVESLADKRRIDLAPKLDSAKTGTVPCNQPLSMQLHTQCPTRPSHKCWDHTRFLHVSIVSWCHCQPRFRRAAPEEL